MPELAAKFPADLITTIPEFAKDYADATRSAGGVVLQSVCNSMPTLFSGSADLYGSTKKLHQGCGRFLAATTTPVETFGFGIREHAMGGHT